MPLSTVLTVIGIFVSLLFGAWAVFLAPKRKYPGQLTFLQESYLPLFDAIVKNLPELKVSFRDEPAGEGLVLLKGALLNTGSKDITPDMIAENITMSLPEGYKWITAELVAHSPKVECIIDNDQQSLVFNMGLFRCSEYLRFETLVEVPIEERESENTAENIGDKLRKAIKVNHRISDTQKVISANLVPVMQAQRRLKRFAIIGGMFAAALIVMAVVYTIRGWPVELQFKISTKSGDVVVKAEYTLDGNVTLKGVESKDYRRTVPAEELFEIEGLAPHLVAKKYAKVFFVIMSIYALFPLLICAGAYWGQRKAKRLRKLLGMTEGDGLLQ